MIIRPSTDADLGRVLACQAADPVGLVPPDRYRGDLASRNYRPDWTWIAEQDGAIVARAVWWGPAASGYPHVLDCLHVSDSDPHWADLAAALLQAGHQAFRDAGAPDPPRYELRLPNAWRASADVSQAVRWRRAAAARAGLTQELERFRFEWTPAAGLPRSTGRLVFRPEPDDEAFIAVFREVATGQPGRDHPPGGGRTGRGPAGPRGLRAVPGHARRPGLVAAGLHRRWPAGRDDPAQPEPVRGGGWLSRRAARHARPRLHRRPGRRDHPVPRRRAASRGSPPPPIPPTSRWRPPSGGPATGKPGSGTCSWHRLRRPASRPAGRPRLRRAAARRSPAAS